MPLLTCNPPQKTQGEFNLDKIRFSLDAGHILGVIGAKGAGKSTLVQLILGGILPDNVDERMDDADEPIKQMQDDIIIDGHSMRFHSDEAKQHLAYVLEECPFSLSMSANDNGKLYGTCYDTWNWDTFRAQCERFDIPMHRRLKKLSRQQRVWFQLAFALSYDAKLYVMDEPGAYLDETYRQVLLDVIQEIVESGTRSVIYVTQRLEDLDRIGDCVLWLEHGRQLFYGEKEKLLDGYRILDGSEKQLRYIEQSEPGRLLIMQPMPNGSEAFVRASGKSYALKVNQRKPTLQELLYYSTAYQKKYHKHLMLRDGLFEEEPKNHKKKHNNYEGEPRNYKKKRGGCEGEPCNSTKASDVCEETSYSYESPFD